MLPSFQPLSSREDNSAIQAGHGPHYTTATVVTWKGLQTRACTASWKGTGFANGKITDSWCKLTADRWSLITRQFSTCNSSRWRRLSFMYNFTQVNVIFYFYPQLLRYKHRQDLKSLSVSLLVIWKVFLHWPLLLIFLTEDFSRASKLPKNMRWGKGYAAGKEASWKPSEKLRATLVLVLPSFREVRNM